MLKKIFVEIYKKKNNIGILPYADISVLKK